MDKFDLIESVREMNPTATVEFLSQFTEYELEEYMNHLLEAEMSPLAALTPSEPFN